MHTLNQELAEESRHEGEPNKHTVNTFASSWLCDFIPKQKSHMTSKPETALKADKKL